ncbi:MAG: hypothetical protein AMJ65_03695 [Phycisphaerae bacterium SG8_4]|nr:MAG: hypothetical protein AMJ65_03695 [Phycisphaerae bacterium SG8_4]
MKILMIIILFLTVLLPGCSSCCDRTESLWLERQMEDDRRIHGNPNESWDRWEDIERVRE